MRGNLKSRQFLITQIVGRTPLYKDRDYSGLFQKCCKFLDSLKIFIIYCHFVLFLSLVFDVFSLVKGPLFTG